MSSQHAAGTVTTPLTMKNGMRNSLAEAVSCNHRVTYSSGSRTGSSIRCTAAAARGARTNPPHWHHHGHQDVVSAMFARGCSWCSWSFAFGLGLVLVRRSSLSKRFAVRFSRALAAGANVPPVRCCTRYRDRGFPYRVHGIAVGADSERAFFGGSGQRLHMDRDFRDTAVVRSHPPSGAARLRSHSSSSMPTPPGV